QAQRVQARSSNAASGILRIEHNGGVALFGADLDRRGWEAIRSDAAWLPHLKAQVFKFPHHGGKLVSDADRLDASGVRSQDYAALLLGDVSPAVTVISTAQWQGWPHPDPGVMPALRAHGT